jgi:TusA-related sulfurtransferase
MSKIVDARGLSCPQPVLMTLDAIKKASDKELSVLVDNEASRENVSRAVASQGWHVDSVSGEDDIYRLEIRKSST